jgi:hypothetical protein
MARKHPNRGGTLTRPDRHVGRPTRLTERTADLILSTVLDGNHLTTACAVAGVGRATLYRWIEEANAAEQAITRGEHPTPQALAYLDFRDRLAQARAEAEVMAVGVVTKAMRGGYLISERPAVDGSGNPIRDDEGKIVMEKVYAQPDGRLALSYLGKSRPDTWGQNPTNRIELTGADGGPVQVQHGPAAAIEPLAERLALLAAERRAEDEAEADYGDVQDAELVEDTDG